VTWSALLGARLGSDAPAVVADDAVWSGDELMQRAGGAADWLDEVGAPEGTAVISLLSASATAIALVIAGASTRRPIAPIGPKLTADELSACVGRLGSAIVVAETEFAGVAAEVAARTGTRLEVLPAVPPSARELDLDPPLDAVAAILHTSGTSGTPKPVPYQQGRLAARVAVNAGLLELGPGSIYASSSPLHHIAGLGMLLVALGSGATLLTFAGFSVQSWLDLGRRHVTHALLVPTTIDILLEHGALRLPTLRTLQYGASPIHPDTLRAAMDALPGVRFVNIFGQTEGSPVTCLTAEDHLLAAGGRSELLRSVGRAAPGVEVRVEGADADGVGEVVARAGHLFQPDPDGWLRTGDLGRLDGDGYLYLAGRRGDKIVRGGENIYPVEVEEVLLSHPAVREVAVVGVPDRRWGEVVKAFVVPSDPTVRPAAEDLRAFARSRLAGFKVPMEWEFIESLPRNQAGKVLRRSLVPDLRDDTRAHFEAGQTWT
jgi:acyl-CoA synthetase (AMP-forming)/AMP-acid ligase II